METLGWSISIVGLVLTALVFWRGRYLRIIGRFPLFYSYLGYGFVGTGAMYLIFWFRRGSYPYAYWLYFLLSIIVEFAVLVEVSDHLFEPFPAIRQLGRFLTLIISIGLGLVYVLPTILYSNGRHSALLGFALRASLTKVAIIVGLLFTAHRYGFKMGRNVAGLLLGFSIYLGVNIVNFAADQFFYQQYSKVLWILPPVAYTLCLLVWLTALWDFVPMPERSTMPASVGTNPATVALELNRFNNELSKFLNK